MKIKADFITNSSSTSFLLIADDELSKPKLLKRLGIESDSPLSFIFEELVETIENEKTEIHDYINSNYPGASIEWFLKEGHYFSFSDQVIDQTVKAIEAGKKVYVGLLSTESSLSNSESFFCQESFLLIDKDLYLNAESSGW